MLTVVHVVHAYRTGGMERGLATLIGRSSDDVRHRVVCLTDSGPAVAWLPEGTPVDELHKPPGNSAVFVARLAAAIHRLAPDVVHTRNWGGLDAVVACRCIGMRGVVHGEHGWTMDDPDGLRPTRVRVRRFLADWVAEYTCVSSQIESWLRNDIGVRRRVTQIYNGVDADRFRPPAPGRKAEVRQALGLGDDAFVVATCGRLDPIKDHRTLLRAFDRVRSACPEAVLLVVGDGPEVDRVRETAGPSVHLLGERGDVADVLAAVDTFVLSSRNEGISNTILEAMACGLPVVATRVGGNPELVADGRTGRLVVPGDPDALAAALETYARRPDERRAHGAAGRSAVESRFRTDAMARGYEEVYRRVTRRA